MAPSLYNTINAAFKKLYRRFQRLEQRVKRIEERLDIESMSSPLEMLDFNDLLTHVTQDQDDHHDSSSSSSLDEDVIRREKPASQRVPQSETEVSDKGKGKEKYTKLPHTNILARDSQFCRRAKPKKLDNVTFESGINGEFKTTPAAVEPSRPSELNGSRTRPAPIAHGAPNDDDDNDDETAPLLAPVSDHHEEPSRTHITRSAARNLGLDILPVNMDDADRNPSPYSKAKRGKRGKRSHENDGSPAKPAWLSQKRSNGRFSKKNRD
ncbi:hypothetical protein D6C85_00862 [Aureobasidium pullulans]|uniref:Uncharacterized protein n=1 Tax=Aureobasidium pullulans TaxID=5580 RepID=A0A4V4L003_AURPU|nr:hypothetical protein D6C85_00862 [Aureobasidium pullulans]